MTVDEILATGQYTDRRGQVWLRCPTECFLGGGWFCRSAIGSARRRVGWHLPESDMRLLIERDQHRDECMGLGSCPDHPVPIVCQNFNEDGAAAWEVVGAHRGNGLIFDLPHSHAMNMARAWAVGE